MQSAFADPPLSPGGFGGFVNMDMLEDGSSSSASSESIDLFKYYLDMNSMQGKMAPESTSTYSHFNLSSTPASQPLPLDDVDQFSSLFAANNANLNTGPNSVANVLCTSNNGVSQQQQPQDQQLFPFAEAAAFPPSAFSPPSISHGSDEPINPALIASLFGATATATAPAAHDHVGSVPSAFSATTPSITPKIEPEEEDQELPPAAGASSAATVNVTNKKTKSSKGTARPVAVASSSSKNKKRAVSEVLQDISEEEEMMGEHDDDDEDRGSGSDSEHEQGGRAGRNGRRSVSTSSSTAKTGKNNKGSGTKKGSAPVSHPHALVPVPDWGDRPSKEEYEKLSSKEKRQLRNKISARNFRHRRKAHIDTLEAEINEKDATISVLREEVGTLRSENQGLRADIEVLKKNWESIAAKISAVTEAPAQAPAPAAATPAASTSQLTPEEDDLYSTASLPALSPASSSDNDSLYDHASVSSASVAAPSIASTSQSKATASTSAGRRIATRSSARPNYRKDISATTGSTIWDNSNSPFGGFRGVDVHTTLVPEINIGSPLTTFTGKRESSKDLSSSAFSYGQNMNPALNGLSHDQLSALRENFLSSSARASSGQKRANDPVKESFFDANPFLLLRNDNLQDYRGQLYSKLAHNVAGIQQAQHAQKTGQSPEFDGMKPAFFSAPEPDSKLPSAAQDAQQAQLTRIGALATKTLFEKMSSAFWDAFAGEQPNTRQIIPDRKKIADVIGGKSRLVVVDNPATSKEDDLDALLGRLDKLDLKKV